MGNLLRMRVWTAFVIVCFIFFYLSGIPAGHSQSLSNIDSLEIEELNLEAWKVGNTQPNAARILAQRAVSKSDSLGFAKGKADGLHILGMMEWSGGDLAQALNFYLRALDIRLSINDSLGLGRSFNNIGNVYFSQENHDSAQVYYEKGLVIREILKDTAGMIFSLSNLGDVALEKGLTQQAEEYYSNSGELALKSTHIVGIAHVKGRQAKLALQLSNTEQAQEYWEEALRYTRISKNHRLIAVALQEVVRLAMLNKQLDIVKHTRYIKESLSLANELDALDLQAEAALLLAQLAAVRDDLEGAYAYQQQYRHLAAELIEENKLKAVAAIQESYATEREAAERLAAEKKIGEALNHRNNLLLTGLLGSIAFFLFLFVIGYYRAYKNQLEQAEKLAAKNEELAARYTDLRDFAKIASHDLREPIRGIGSFADLLKRRHGKTLDQDGREYLGFILGGASKMNALLDDLLTFVNIINDNQHKAEIVETSQLVENIISDYKQLPTMKAQFEIAALPGVMSYPKLLKILFEELIDNALKFNDKPAPLIAVGYKAEKEKHLFWVRDNGIGIEEIFQEQVFNIFHRLEKQRFPGNGMGLALSKRIANAHGGQIWINSKPNEGSTFYFTLSRTIG